jgi:hypothetical protein
VELSLSCLRARGMFVRDLDHFVVAREICSRIPHDARSRLCR